MFHVNSLVLPSRGYFRRRGKNSVGFFLGLAVLLDIYSNPMVFELFGSRPIVGNIHFHLKSTHIHVWYMANM